jgi:hypothetical protein
MQLIKNSDKSIIFIPETDSDNSFLEYFSGLFECRNEKTTTSQIMGGYFPLVVDAIGHEQTQPPFSLHWIPPVFGEQENLESSSSPDLD